MSSGCFVCGYAVESRPVDLVVNGRLEPAWLCPPHLNDLCRAVEQTRAGRSSVAGLASRPANGRDGSHDPTSSIRKGL